MNYTIEYSPLNYYNSQVSNECLCLGILFHNLTTNVRDFIYISNFKRFQAFDDEADIHFVKLYLKSIKEDVSENLFTKEQTFSINEYKKIFVNDFRFQKTVKIESNDYEKTVSNISKLYMKYDLEKAKRLSKNDEKELIKSILNAQYFSYTNGKTKGAYEDDILFDYVADHLFVKYFSFNGENLRSTINRARQWAFAAEEVKDKGQVLYIYNTDNQDEYNLKIILNILEKNAKVAQLAEVSEIIKELA